MIPILVVTNRARSASLLSDASLQRLDFSISPSSSWLGKIDSAALKLQFTP